MIEISTHPGDAIFVERMAAGNGLCGEYLCLSGRMTACLSC
nr:MAG TPA: hypothetical protein [Caudoviricetes sp.]